MFPIDTARAVAVMPAPSAPGAAGYFTDGNAGTGVPATILPAEFLNMVMVEMINLVAAGGLVPAKGDYTQIASAVKKIALASQVGVVGAARNASMNVTAASSTATFTADELVVESALGGLRYCLANFNAPINLASTGVGGMDTGSAPTSGFVGIYAIYNPTSGAKGLLGVNATLAKVPEVYAGVNMPVGYTTSALISVWGTDSTGKLLPGAQRDRSIGFAPRAILITSAQTGISWSSFNIAGISVAAVPRNARRVKGTTIINGSTAATMAMYVAADSNGMDSGGGTYGPNVQGGGNFDSIIATEQTLFYQASIGAGTPGFSAAATRYDF